jgi:hypothetical protein
MIESWAAEPDSQFDADFAEGFVGRSLLVGVTRLALDGTVAYQEQMRGRIVAATALGIDVELRGVNEGVVWRMAPFLDDLEPAPAGVYALRSTGESVENPDFLFSLTIRSGDRH